MRMSECIRIRVRNGHIWDYERDVKIVNKEKILKKLSEFGVSDPEYLLNTWIASFDSSDLTAVQYDYLKRIKEKSPDVVKYLESITECVD
ncbi:MAG: hypothetical protein DRJ30_07115 [Candidatus Methanomethylicota archaeon]|nr:MAG: hypothetical protein DRJ30_07115 [Candidatus Verstraetearchaeota archaeon]